MPEYERASTQVEAWEMEERVGTYTSCARCCLGNTARIRAKRRRKRGQAGVGLPAMQHGRPGVRCDGQKVKQNTQQGHEST